VPVSSAGSKERLNKKDEQGREGVLRLEDIVPPYTSGKQQRLESKDNSENSGGMRGEEGKSAREEISKSQREASSNRGGDSEIPRFDLAEEIMAAQRTKASRSRKGPGYLQGDEKVEADRGVDNDVSGGGASRLQQDSVIAEIVARDIERLCGGREGQSDVT